jgi:hypothetical protein
LAGFGDFLLEQNGTEIYRSQESGVENCKTAVESAVVAYGLKNRTTAIPQKYVQLREALTTGITIQQVP